MYLDHFGLNEPPFRITPHTDFFFDGANRGATLVPLGVLRRSIHALKLAEIAARRGNPNSLSDAGVAALVGLACAEGAFYNVRINLKSLGADSAEFTKTTGEEGARLVTEAETISDRVRALVRERLA